MHKYHTFAPPFTSYSSFPRYTFFCYNKHRLGCPLFPCGYEVDGLPSSVRLTLLSFMPSNEKRTAARLAQSRWASIVLSKDEATTTAAALITIAAQAIHSNTGELIDEERDALSWLLHILGNLHDDIGTGIPE